MNRIEIINTWNLARVFQELEQGNMRIPRFQRSYVWEKSKIVKLLNSIYHEYPIGSFFLWEADAEMEGFCRDITEFGFPSKPEGNRFSFILDGQQRITSLYVALKGKKLAGTDYSNICFNLERKVFNNLGHQSLPDNIPAWKLFDYSEFQDLLIEYSSKGEIGKAKTLSDCKNIFDNYPVSIISSKNMDLADVVTIFERINQGGKRLSLFDLVHASVWSTDFDLREKIEEFNKEKGIQIFGKIDNEIFTQSLALNTSRDCVKRHQLALKNEECKTAWPRTTECIRLAIDFMKSQLGVQSIEIIPYQNIIPVIQYYFFILNEGSVRPEHKKALVDWFWSLTFSNRYSSSTLTKMKNDALWIEKLIKDPSLSRVFTVKLVADDLKRVKMGTRSVIKNGVLCLMALRKPVDFDNGNIVTLDKTNASRQNSKENHHFFPYSLAPKMGIKREEINSLVNFAFISKHLNLQISNKYPSKYLAEYANENHDLTTDLLTHFITQTAYEAALNDDFQSFMEERSKSILEEINKVCRINDNIETVNSNLDDDYVDDDYEMEDSFPEKPEQPKNRIWLIASSPKFFKLKECFDKYGCIYWNQHFNYRAGDTAYIYVSSPERKVTYKVAIEQSDLPYFKELEREREFYVNPDDFNNKEKHNRVALFRLLDTTESTSLDYASLLEHGLKGPVQGVIDLSYPDNVELLEYIEQNF